MFSFLKKKTDPDMWLVVGLGNPGDQYKNNRHNIGFMAVDAIASDCNATFRSKFQAHLAEARIGVHKAVLLKPQTFMNNSGLSVVQAAKFYKIDPDRIVVFHDELDLPAGKIKTKKGGGHAGHNGLRSMDSHLNSQDYWRIRMGIGHPGDKARVHGHVLSDFGKTEREWVDPIVKSVAKHLGLMLDGKDNDFMSKVAMDVPSPSPLRANNQE
jgi:PTH1 family peptidyl-tRNA hydrolase